MNKKPFYVGLLVVAGCALGLAGCTVDEDESSDGSSGWGPQTPQEEGGADDENEETAEANETATLMAQPFPNCGILACPNGTKCAFDEWGDALCMAPAGTTCTTVDCGEYFHCEMTPAGAVCAAGGAGS